MKYFLNAEVPAFMQIDLKDCVLYIKDGSDPQNSIEIKIGEGNLTYSEKVEREYTLNRGLLDEVRDGDEQPMDVSFDLTWEYVRGRNSTGATPTVEDALKNQGGAADWTSSDSDQCRPFAVDIVVVNTPDCSTGDVETITLPDFRYEDLSHDLRAGTISCSGRCNATTATATRAAQ